MKSLILTLCLLLGAATAAPVDLIAPDLDGRTRQLSEFRGKWVVANYWATWCPPCREEIPELEVFHFNHKDKDAVVVGLNLEAISLDKLRDFVEEQFISYPILRLGRRPARMLGRVPGLPTTFLISPEGEIVARWVGPVTREILERAIRRHREKAS